MEAAILYLVTGALVSYLVLLAKTLPRENRRENGI